MYVLSWIPSIATSPYSIRGTVRRTCTKSSLVDQTTPLLPPYMSDLACKTTQCDAHHNIIETLNSLRGVSMLVYYTLDTLLLFACTCTTQCTCMFQ